MVSHGDKRSYIRNALLASKGNISEVYSKYEEFKKLFNCYWEMGTYCREVRRVKKLLKPEEINSSYQNDDSPKMDEILDIESGDSREIFCEVSDFIDTPEKLLERCKIDLSIWNMEEPRVKSWQVQLKGGKITHFFSIGLSFKKKKLDKLIFEPITPVRIVSNIPVTRNQNIKPDKSFKTCYIISDAQFGLFRKEWHSDLTPIHCRNTLTLFLDAVAKDNPEVIILNGDMLDLSEFSDHFVTSPEFSQLTNPALIEFSLFLKQLRKICPNSKIMYLAGNHEIRFNRAVKKNFIAGYGLKKIDYSRIDLTEQEPLLAIEHILSLKDLNIEYIEDYPETITLNENIEIEHGSICRGKSGATTQAYIRDAIKSLIVGHIHRSEHATKTLSNGDIVEIHSFGCACRLDGAVPSYKKRMNWQKGFGKIIYNDYFHSIIPIQVFNDQYAIIDNCILDAEKSSYKDLFIKHVKEVYHNGRNEL